MMYATNFPGLDIVPLHRYLTQHLGADGNRALDVSLLAGGRSNVSYRITQGENDWVLRRPPLGNRLPSAHDMVREFRVLTGLSRAGFPVPRPVNLCEDEEIIGAPFLIMDFVEGRVIATAQDAAALSAAEASVASQSLVDALARLHSLDPAEAGLQSLGRPEGYLGRQVARWSDQWARTATRQLDDIDTLIAWLGERIPRIPQGLPWSIVHGDFRIDNVILAPDLGARAVLDWEMSTLGDPVSDLAISLVYWSEAGDGLRKQLEVAQHVTDGEGFWNRERIVDEYSRLTSLDLGHLDECLALACFKLAVIMESIHKRSLDGDQLGASAEATGGMGRAAEGLARIGVNVTRGGGLAALGS